MQSQAQEISDDQVRVSVEREIETIKQRLATVQDTLNKQQIHAVEMIQSTPPPEFQEKYSSIKAAVDDAVPFVTKEFKYDSLQNLEKLLESCKVRIGLYLHFSEL